MSAPQRCDCGWLLPEDFALVCNEKTYVADHRNGHKTTLRLTCPQCGATCTKPDGLLTREQPAELDS